METFACEGKGFSDFFSILGELCMWKVFEERFIVYVEYRRLERILFWEAKLNTLRCFVIKDYVYIGVLVFY